MIRIVGLRYTKVGNLSRLIVKHTHVDDLLEYTVIVLTSTRTLNPLVTTIEKIERWRKLQVHGVLLDCYLYEGGLDLACKEIELMTSKRLLYALYWIRSDSLE